MKILFLYRYGVLGGVCTQLYHRFRNLSHEKGLEIHCGFRSDHGVTEMLSPYATLHFGLNESTAKDLLNEEQFDVVIIIDSEEYIQAVRNSNYSGLVFIEVHTSIEKNLEYLSRLKNDDLDALIVVSKYIQERVSHHVSNELIGKRIIIVPNVIDSELFKPISFEEKLPKVIAWVGKIDDHKDWKTFLKIAEKIHDKDDTIEFWMAGGETCSDEKAQELLDFAEKCGVVSRLRWFDRIENRKMNNFYSLVSARNGISLVTSHCESFGMTILESLFSGCPVVATDVGAIPEIKEMDDYLQLYSLHDVDTAAELCLNSIESAENIRKKFPDKRKILIERYCSIIHSKYYLRMLEVFKLRNGEDNDELLAGLEHIQFNSEIRVSVIYNREMLLKPKDYDAPVLKITNSQMNTKLKVGCIMDEFSYSSYCDVFDLVNVSLLNWKNELIEHKPDFFFLESAWKGKDCDWEHKINRMDNEILLLLKWCRESMIPIVFWNKEDPVHFNTFLSTAQQCDYIFTTDFDVIRDYKRILGHENVFLLPFAANQMLTNPISKYSRKPGASFAGAYYLKYRDRAKNLSSMISGISKIMPLEIYDRFYNTTDIRYSFPEEYQKYIIGTLAYNEIDIAYKGYEYGINMNSVKQSQSMFARRVFELMASNTIVLSNYSRAMRMQFGDLIICSDDKDEITRRIATGFQTGIDVDKKKLIALRKTLTTNTYVQRAQHIIDKIGNSTNYATVIANILVICRVNSEHELEIARNNFHRQKYENKDLVIVFENERLDSVKPNEIHICRNDNKKVLAGYNRKLMECDYTAIMDSNDYYAEYYLVDLISASSYSESEIITKNRYYSFADGGITLGSMSDAGDYQYSSKYNLNCTLFKNSEVVTSAFKSFIFEGVFENSDISPIIFGIDRFNYCKGVNHENLASQLKTIDSQSTNVNSGIEIIDYLHAEHKADERVNSTPNSKSLSPKWFYSNLNIPSDSDVRMSMSENILLIESKLSANSHEYIYARNTRTIDDVLTMDQGIFFEKSPGLDVMAVILYLDDEKKRIGNQVLSANKNLKLEFPFETKHVQFGLRILSSGVCEIGNLNLQMKDLSPSQIITPNRNLLISNNYPSYSNLYRNQFLHSRIEGYFAKGVPFDVFILNSESAIQYYEFHDVDVITGSASALKNLLKTKKYDAMFVHFLDEEIWDIVEKVLPSQKLCIWAHGAEIQPYERRAFNYSTPDEHELAKKESLIRMTFWKKVFSSLKSNMKMIFVSKYFSEEVFQDLQIKLKHEQYEVIHNPIDVQRFGYKVKAKEKRKKILSIRTFATRKYANDITVNTILELSKHPEFSDMEFFIVGDGVLFDEVTRPLEGFSNVILKKGFLTNEEYKDIFEEYGIFLIPTRWDSQGVSRDEAMSAGLIPATNRVAAIPEFVDDSCSILSDPEDHMGLAEGILDLYQNPDKFLKMSDNAANRVRIQTAADITISKELKLINEG
tara:strand:+ start:3109 stop:7521 length:4413 start_codon:yes stop_codon:yes gene_type:complete